MTVDRLVAALTAADIDATGVEVAEAIWFANRIAEAEGPSASGDDRGRAGADVPSLPLPSGHNTPKRILPPEPDAPGVAPSGEAADSGPSEEAASLYPPDISGSIAPTGSDAPAGIVRSPAAAVLPGGLNLLRALRPLKRRVPSARHVLLDEEATADRIADERLVLPLLVPAPERWLSLVLVADASPSMAVWQQLVDELRELLERLGAFRNIRVRYLRTGEDGRLGIDPTAVPSGSPHSPRELVDPSGRQAVLVISDCVDGVWRSGEAEGILGLWGRKGPLAILQPLPQRLWHRSGIAPVTVRLHAAAPGVPNTRLVASPHPSLPGSEALAGMPVPVLEIEPEWLASWARLVCGTAYGGVDALVAMAGPYRPRLGGQPYPGGDGIPEDERPSPADLVRKFRSVASPQAFRLAGYLAVAPLTLPVMRLVQYAMLPVSRPAHLAEFFVSGLLRDDSGTAPYGESAYEFVPGVRDVLLGTIRRSETAQVYEKVSAYISARAGQSRDMTAMARLPQGQGDGSLGEAHQPYARIPLEVLRRLGHVDELAVDTDEPPSPAQEGVPRDGAEEPSSPSEPAPGEGGWRTSMPADGKEPSSASFGSMSSGRVHQPMLFVGLGGTGARIGADLERGLRAGLCGPDGLRLVSEGRRAPFQLPDFLQFVYADFSESELNRLPHLSAKGTEAAAYARTARVIHDLLPANYDSSPEVTRMLRVALHDETHDWLPPQDRQPRVAPLHNGAGQLPTVGRAALFATLRGGLEPVLRQLRAAIGTIANSAADLQEMGEQRIRSCDVFVAFSVAGGTGAGIFYDFLHLVGHEFRRSKVPGVRIYPLVLMPSAFPPGAGGGREAELNAARALVDLSRLVDDQNVPDAQADLGDLEHHGTLGIRYPGGSHVVLPSSTVQTATLFSRPSRVRPEDLRRSITAMMLSLIGNEMTDEDRTPVSFSDSFVNRSVERSAPSRSGIGYRGMSTSLAASLTVPVDDLAEIVAGRLLAQGVREMAEDARRHDEDGTQLIRDMFDRCGIAPLWSRTAPAIPLPDPLPRGSRAIGQALRDRIGDMEHGLGRLDRELSREIPRLVEDFKPGTGARELLGLLGPFRLEGVLTGLPGHPDSAVEAGFAGMLDNRKNDPERPEGVEHFAPQVPRIRGSVGGMVPVRWSSPQVQEAVDKQDAWYRWQTNRQWHQGWKEHESRWRPPLMRSTKEVTELVRALRADEEDEHKRFAERLKELYRDDRTGVSYLLPPQNNLRALYDDVFDRLAQHESLPENADAAGLLNRLVHPEDWQRALDAVRRSPHAAVKEIKQVVERRVKALFGEASVLDDRPLLPSLGVLLRAAAGDEDAEATVDSRWLEQFRSQLAGLLPVGFTPDGSGPLKVLVLYPQSEDGRATRYLQQELNLPRDPGTAPEFRAVEAESITVVLLRTGMSLTDVPEARHVLRLWAEARDTPGGDDFLHWRQRLGYRDDWLASTEGDRRRILHRLLCAMWNDHVDTEGDPNSPDLIRIRLQEGDSAAMMTLRLDSFDEGVSSWAGLLRAYERWALLDEGQIIEEFCDRLMRTRPTGLSTTPAPPSRLFHRLVHEVAPRQLTLLEGLSREIDVWPEEALVPLRSFWEHTLNGALDLPFPTARRPFRPTLRTLASHFAEETPTGRVVR
ncbi:SAV_2336 N-terminal domain-related protein [Streptomyces sp. NPDC059096]|uniref:SAV_2336 N-terminal domain-related protein n=1 Tax=Streptomyces sp. NPDC059096 TaxID=3346727 RepID=UPI0036BACA5B